MEVQKYGIGTEFKLSKQLSGQAGLWHIHFSNGNHPGIFPNPSVDQIIVSLSGFEKDKPVAVSAMDVQGGLMEKTTGLGGKEVVISVKSYTIGTYFVKMQQRNVKVLRQFSKK